MMSMSGVDGTEMVRGDPSTGVMSQTRESFHEERSVSGHGPSMVSDRSGCRIREQVSDRSKAEIEPCADFNLSIEPVLGPDHIPQRAKPHATPGGEVKYRQWIVGSEQQADLHFRVMSEIQQHLQSMGLSEGGNVGIEVRITFAQVPKSWKKLLMQYEAIAAGVGSNDGHPFVQRQAEPIGVSQGLVFADQAKFVTNMAQEWQSSLSQCTIERPISLIRWIEVLRVR